MHVFWSMVASLMTQGPRMFSGPRKSRRVWGRRRERGVRHTGIRTTARTNPLPDTYHLEWDLLTKITDTFAARWQERGKCGN